MARLVALVMLLGVACAGAPRNKPSWPDAPVELRDDVDREAAIDQLWVISPGPDRDRLRTAIADATAKRLEDAVREEKPFVAAQLLDQLTSLWMSDPKQLALGLASHTALIHDLRKTFARSGALEPAVQTLILLAEIDREKRALYLGELEEILVFADDLAIAENGRDAVRSQQIMLLQPTALQLPLPWLVDKYVTLVVDRQRAVAALLEAYQKSPPPCTPGDAGCPSASGVTIELVRAHHDILATSHRIANVLARAGRAGEIHRHLVNLKGIGSEREVSARAEVLAEHPTADAYGELASTLRADEHAPDPGAALALCQAGLAIDPVNHGLLSSAGSDARALDRIDQSIFFYEAALSGPAELDTQLALRLGKLYGDRIARLAASGRPSAADHAWQKAVAFTGRAAKQHPSEVWQQAAAIAESALGKGLASQGMIDAGRRALTASLERAPSTDAYESLTTIDVQTARYKDAQKWAAAGIALLGDTTAGDRYRRAKLERLAADALRRAGKTKEAAGRYLDSLRTWASLGETKELPRAIAAERLLDSGRAMWWLGDRARSIDLISKAVDFDPSAGTATSGAVAFLIESEHYRAALDVYYRGLGEPEGSELFKVYTSLWILAEGKRQGLPPDRLATEYLGSRRGNLWYELLARAAIGKVTFDELRRAATTGPRKAELAFYGAVLGLDPAAATPEGKRKLLEDVIRARAVLDAEFDLARKYLSTP
jgi:tetratricopeptide (TPR) repeat protein